MKTAHWLVSGCAVGVLRYVGKGIHLDENNILWRDFFRNEFGFTKGAISPQMALAKALIC